MTHAANMPFSAATRKQREVFIAFRDSSLIQITLFHLSVDGLNLHEHCHANQCVIAKENEESPGTFCNFLTLEHFCQTES